MQFVSTYKPFKKFYIAIIFIELGHKFVPLVEFNRMKYKDF